VWSHLVDPLVERGRRPQQRLEAHRRRAQRRAPQVARIVHREGQHRRLHLGAVDERETFLGLELDGLDAGSAQRVGRRRPHRPSPTAGRRVGHCDVALPHHRVGDVRQGRQVAARPDAALLRHHGVDAGVQHPGNGLRHRSACAAGLPQQHVGTQQHRRADHVGGKRLSHPGHVTPNEVALQLEELVGGNTYVGQLAKARIHAVDRLPGSQHALHRRAGTVGALRGLAADLDGGKLASDRDHIGDGEGITGEYDSLGHHWQYRPLTGEGGKGKPVGQLTRTLGPRSCGTASVPRTPGALVVRFRFPASLLSAL
jgi:hypothetical protein